MALPSSSVQLALLLSATTIAALLTTTAAQQSSTVDFIAGHNYPVETHAVNTSDGYVLNIYRIPHSPHLPSSLRDSRKPAILLLHGFVLTSDAWVLPHPKAGLAYLLADAGFDVWLGNQRGNTYARQHVSLSAEEQPFWNFSWHEIGYYDLAAMLDYITQRTGESNLHFVGYSQGTSALLVLLSSRPEYRDKVKSVHLLAPVAFMQRMQQPLMKVGALILDYFNALANFLGYREIFHFTQTPFYRKICGFLCADGSLMQSGCYKLYELIGGPGTRHTNESLLTDICETHPAGASTKQILHFLQVYSSGKFQQFDYGALRNMQHYQQPTPPTYDIANISNCMHLYYSDNDYMSAAEDVESLAKALPCAELQRIPHADWNHYDFIWSKDMKDVLNDRIVAKINAIEQGSII